MQDDLAVLLEDAKHSILVIKELSSLEQIRLQYLGKKGRVTELLKGLSQVSAVERPKLGKEINHVKQQIIELLDRQEKILKTQSLEFEIQAEALDITLSGRGKLLGNRHPITQVSERVTILFQGMGFNVAEGPEVEDDFHNFGALNFQSHHPARDAMDTFYFPDGRLLRTHTSSVQIHVMEKQRPPLRVITPGRVYRRDSDPTHTPMFHQVEGLVVDQHCTFSELKGLLQDFFTKYFETPLKLRFRPSYFPFTEPSAEVDIEHLLCQGNNCRVCGGSGWIEVLGCGMVHPNVLRNVDIDSDKYIGFAFGLGLDRLAMLRYGVDDLRTFFENDLRFLQQF